jgi:hypothetical protein
MIPEWGTHHPMSVSTQPLFYAPFSYAPCQFTSLLNLRPVIFGLTLFGWLLAIMPNHYL